jgi:hypothetical protein
MKRKIIALLAGLLILSFLAWLSIKLINRKGKSDSKLIEFSISDTTNISKIIITDAQSNKITLVNKNGSWTESNGDCISQQNVSFILDAAKNIEFKGYLPENSTRKFTELMSSQHTKVEFFVKGEWEKTWYIGPSSQDHYGQIMLLETKDEGKSTRPVMMRIKGLKGIIEPRFFADKRKWMCTNIFALSVDEIKNVNVQFIDEPSRSFSVSKNQQNFIVKQGLNSLSAVDTTNIYRYLQAYKKIHFALPNYEMSPSQCDSIKKSLPFCKLQVTQTNGKSTLLKLYRIKAKEQERNEFGELVNMDMNNFWCILPNGQLVKCQYFVFNPLLLGHVYFPAMVLEKKPPTK